MKLGNKKVLRAFYIIIVPVLLVVFLLNSGFLQSKVTAVKVDGESFNSAQYNYYYFTELNAFIDEYFDEDGKNGPFDDTISLSDQYIDDETSWEDYFKEKAENHIKETKALNELAEEADYEYSGEELAPVNEQLEYIGSDAEENGISLKNYLVAYWGNGMSEKIYTAELTKDTKAAAYKSALAKTLSVSESDIEKWISENNPESYLTANIKLIVLYAAPNRFTGEVGNSELSDLESKLERLWERYQQNPSEFKALSDAFNDDEELREQGGILENVSKDDIPEVLSDWVFEWPDVRAAAIMDSDNNAAYLAVLDGEGRDNAEISAENALEGEAADTLLTEKCENMTVKYIWLGSRLIGK